ncbi:MAG: hypothetical protein VB142_00725 [Burkholderia sp.]
MIEARGELLAFKLIKSAEQSWRRIRVPEKLGGIAFKDGVPVIDSTPAQQSHDRLIMPTPCTPGLTLTPWNRGKVRMHLQKSSNKSSILC